MGLFGFKSEKDKTETLLGQSLLRLEINTILKSNMTAEPMPPLPLALLSILDDYLTRLALLGAEWTRIAEALREKRITITASGQAATEAEVRTQLTPTSETFDAVRTVATQLREAKESENRDATVLTRIIQCCELIMDIIKRLPKTGMLSLHLGMTREQLQDREPPLRLGPYDISATQILRIRKIWDIGTEEIVAQTSIDLTGDVVMRITPWLLKEENKALLDVHRDAVTTSTGYWKDLMGTAVALVSSAVRWLK